LSDVKWLFIFKPAIMLLITLLLYTALAGAYLLVLPAALYAYMNARWYVASSFERAFMYFLVFFFFPGLILLPANATN
jgi:NAD(P)H-quinone oxidoreductase subunit L